MSIPIMLPPPPPPRMRHNIYKCTGSPFHLARRNTWHLSSSEKLWVNINVSDIDRLQRIQNRAARIVLNARKYDHVSPLLKQLHWLPVSKRIMYKVALIVYKSIHSLTPQYISCLFSPVQQSRYSLRSRTDPHLLKIPYINLKKGEQNISFFGPYSLE